jgi:hypothetical protein
MSISWKGYWEPTPKGIRKIADSLLASATLISGYALMNDHPKLATIVMIVAGIAKFASNFFTDNSQES